MEINSIYDQFLAAQQAWPKNLCLRFEQKTWNYTQVLHEIDKAASKLVDLGVKKGDIVACSLPNCPESIYLFYAISKIGAISYNIHPLTTPYEMKTFIERSGAKFLIAIALNAEKFRRALKDDVKVVYVNPYRGVNLIKAIGLYFMGLHHKGLYYYHKLKTHIKTERVIVNKEDDSVYLNTGGTNGRPKIARLSNVSINHLAKKTYPLLIDGKREKIKMLCAIPLFHGFGLAMGIHTPLTHGASTCLMLSFRTKMAIKHIRKAEATTIIGVPALYNALLSRPKFYGPHLKEQIIAFIGGDSVPSSLLDRWNHAMIDWGSEARLYQGYGLTETVNVTNVNFKNNNKDGTVGKPLPGIKEIIVTPNTDEVLKTGENGELLISGDCLMNGYLNDEELNKHAFTIIDGTRYYRTTDYGHIDEDGYFTFKNRLRRTVKISGETMCPSDVEDVIISIPEVYEAYCYGVKNERKGHVLRLAIVINKNCKLTEGEVIAKCYQAIGEKLNPSYMPDKVLIIDKLPRTAIGKVDPVAFKQITGGEELE